MNERLSRENKAGIVVKTVIGHATFLGIISRTTPLKKNMKGVWTEVSPFPYPSLLQATLIQLILPFAHLEIKRLAGHTGLRLHLLRGRGPGCVSQKVLKGLVNLSSTLTRARSVRMRASNREKRVARSVIHSKRLS